MGDFLMERALNAPVLKKRGGEWAPVKPKKSGPSKADFNSRARDYLKEKGLFPYRVDHYNGALKMSQDAFGIFDFIAFAPGRTVGVQVTSKSNLSARRKKILESSAYGRCKASGWDVLLLTFEKVSNRWVATETWL